MPLKVFPVVGPVHYSDDFNVQKPDGRYHRATDIFAAMGAPVVAVDDGVAKGGTDPKGGNVVHLKADDGVDYYYAHLKDPTDSVNGRVSAGDVLGGVGMTGNAIYTTPHLHLAMRVNGAPVDPYPLLKEAEKAPAATPKPSNTAAVIAGVTMIAGAVAAALVITRGPHRRPRLRSAYAR